MPADRRAVTATKFLRNSHWGRADAMTRLGRLTDARSDWDMTVELSPPDEQPKYRHERARVLARLGLYAEAAAGVGRPAPISPEEIGELLWALAD